MTQVIYNVTITTGGATGTGAGFIDDKRIDTYNAVYTEANALSKKRANLRYMQIIQALGMAANPQVLSTTATGADQDSEATSFLMQIAFPSEESVTIIRNGSPILGIAAVKEMVAESLSTEQTHVTDVWSATSVSTTQTVVVGAAAANIAAARALVTVVVA